MLDILTIPIILNVGQNFFYYLLLMEKLQSRIDKIFKLKIKFKLLNNGKNLKYTIKYNMWNYREYILRLFYEREIRNKARLQLKQEKKHEIYSDVEETLNKKQDLENEKKMVNIGCVRCDNTKCQLYSSSQILLKEIQKNLREKMQQKGGFNAEEMSEAENLVSHCKCIEEWDKYEEVLKSVELTCKNCGHELLNNTVLNPRYIMYLQKKAKHFKCVE